jgi:hypothetical protein
MCFLYKWPDGSIHRVPPPTKEELEQYSLLFAHRTLFKEGPIEFQVHDPLPECLRGSIENDLTMTIEEAQRRYPDADIAEMEK